MSEHENQLDFIRGLIREEEKEAQRLLEGSDFERKLEERIQEVPQRVFLRSRRFAWVAAAACLLLAVVVFILVRQRPSPSVVEEDLLSAVEGFFQEAPGIQMLVQTDEQGESLPIIESGSESAFVGFLAQQISLFKSELHQEMLTPEAGPQLEDIPQLTLEERMRLLIKEKELHKFLYRYLKTIKEEKDETKSLSYFFDGDSFHSPFGC